MSGSQGNACDPTEQKCSAKNGLCDVCQLFGAEGQKRRFGLEIQENQISDATIQSTITANRTYTDKQGNKKTPTWYFRDPTKKDVKPPPPNTPKNGTFTVKIQSLHPDFKPEILGGLIQFIADWSALGARPQMGFGVIQIEERIETQALYDWLKKVEGEHKYPELPSLHNIFLAKIQPKDSNKAFTEEDTFNLKYDLRKLFRAEQDTAQQKNQGNKPILKKDKEEELRHFIMGAAPDDKKGNKTEDNSIAAKVKISLPYPRDNSKFMRVWGWIPEEAEVYKNGWNREKVIHEIYCHLTENYTLKVANTKQVWREMKSVRDETTPDETDAKVFLHSLFESPKLGRSGNDGGLK